VNSPWSEAVTEILSKQLPLRKATLEKSLELLVQLHSPPFVIVETGTLRNLDFVSNGCSTLLFQEFLRDAGGKLLSIDIDPKACEFSRLHVDRSIVTVLEMDSIDALREIDSHISIGGDGVPFVYLDSLDVDFRNPQRAAEQTMGEYNAVASRLSVEAVLLVDDTPAGREYLPPWIEASVWSEIFFPTGKGMNLLGRKDATTIDHRYQLLQVYAERCS